MTQLVINTLTEVFGADGEIEIDEEKPRIGFVLRLVSEEKEEAVQGVLKGFRLQLSELRKMYPSHLKVSD